MGNALNSIRCPNRQTDDGTTVDITDPTLNNSEVPTTPAGYDLESQAPLLKPPTEEEKKQGIKCGCCNGGIHTASSPSTAAGSSATSTSAAAAVNPHIGTDITAPFKPLLVVEAVGPLSCNMAILGDPETKEAVCAHHTCTCTCSFIMLSESSRFVLHL